ncbi:sericin-1-like [Oncorhynchus masou masou]|uniref:sericin-1-like n=1 Tax=Oncorhynchus masou masou TaxID=90313 RepID=UPI003182F4CD
MVCHSKDDQQPVLSPSATLAADLGLGTLATGPEWTGDSSSAGVNDDSGSAGQAGDSGIAGVKDDSGIAGVTGGSGSSWLTDGSGSSWLTDSSGQTGDSGSTGQEEGSGSAGQAGTPVERRRRDSLVRGPAIGELVRGGGTG